METIQDTVITIIKTFTYLSRPITRETSLYEDLAFDSLTFIQLLLEIEQTFDITVSISEMQPCLNVGNLIALVETKRKETDNHAETTIKEP